MELGLLTAELCLAYASLALIRWRQSERHLQAGGLDYPSWIRLQRESGIPHLTTIHRNDEGSRSADIGGTQFVESNQPQVKRVSPASVRGSIDERKNCRAAMTLPVHQSRAMYECQPSHGGAGKEYAPVQPGQT